MEQSSARRLGWDEDMAHCTRRPPRAGFVGGRGQSAGMDAPIWPRPLPAGGTIGICSPSGPSDPGALDRAAEALRSRGYRVVLAPGAADRHPDLDYLAGTDARRADDLNRLFADPDIDLVLCARGGYGAARLLDRLDFEAIRRDPKPLVGYSDITALNLALWARAGVISYSGIMATAGDGFGEETLDPFSEAGFFDAVSSGQGAELGSPPESRPRVVRPPASGVATLSGRLMPVCLTLLESLASTPYVPPPDGALLLIEDVHEPPYAVDRALTQLRLSGFLDRLSGVLVGTFTGGPEPDGEFGHQVAELVATLAGAHVPVVSGIAYGHVPRRLTLPCGADAVFDTETASFRFAQG